MEDRTVVIQSLMFAPQFERKNIINVEPTREHITEPAMTSFAGVFNGHGGDECNNYLMDNLPGQIRAHMLAEREKEKNLRKQVEILLVVVFTLSKSEDSASLRTEKDFTSPRVAPQKVASLWCKCNFNGSLTLRCECGG